MSQDKGNNLKSLKIFVFSMGALLIGGIILLFVIIYQRNQAHLAKTTKECVFDKKLPIKGTIKNIIKNEDNMVILVENINKQHIITLNSCSFEILSSASIDRD